VLIKKLLTDVPFLFVLFSDTRLRIKEVKPTGNRQH
jgi:hypothetical protein